MIYSVLHWVAGILLHWFYSDIRVDGAERIPQSGPLLVAVNHPNAMVDSLVAGWVIPRRLRFTAKATLFLNPFSAFVFRLIGVIPLRRSTDRVGSAGEDSLHNRNAFGEIVRALRENGTVLIFPEGRSNGDSLMPLKTGLARVALEARSTGVSGVTILPLGLSFEDKGEPGSRIVARVGEPLNVDSWNGESARALTEALRERLMVAAENSGFGARPQAETKPPRSWIVRAAGIWGRTTHEIPVRWARRLAVSRSRDADQPAMLTMLFGIAFVLASYCVHAAIVGLVTRSVVLTTLYLATLVAGAYWTAFEGHARREATPSSPSSSFPLQRPPQAELKA